jgi:hypothetical protein
LDKEDIKTLNYEGENAVFDNISMCCFCKTKENILLWSHYSDEHRGLCLGFETYKNEYDDSLFIEFNDDRLFLKSYQYPSGVRCGSMPLWNAIYSDRRIREINWFNERPISILYKILHKSNIWEYEEEMRIVLLGNLENRNIVFNKNSLNEVIFGLYTSEEDINIVNKIIKTYYGENVKLLKCIRNEFDYKISFENI